MLKSNVKSTVSAPEDEKDKEHIFGVPIADVKKIRELDEKTIADYRSIIECRRLKEKMKNCGALMLNCTVVVFLLTMMIWLTSPTLHLGREVKLNCSKPATFGYTMKPYTFIIDDPLRKDKNTSEVKRHTYKVYPC